MTNATLSDKERLLDLQSRLPHLEELARAETSFLMTNGTASNPFAGSGKRLEDLRIEIREIEARMQHAELTKALDEFRSLHNELATALAKRRAAEHNLKTRQEHPAVVKWLAAPSVAMACGYGHSLVLFADWWLSGRARYNAAPQCTPFFLDSPQCPPELHFTESEREPVRRWAEAKHSADVALMSWNSLNDRIAELLRKYPVLRDAQV